MVLTIFLTLFGCAGGFVAAYICTHCCCCGSNSNSSSNSSSSSDSSNMAFKEHIKYLTDQAVKEWLRIDIENMQRQYVAIENAKSRGERFNDFNFIEPEPETVDLISVKTAGDDELKRNVLALEEPKEQLRLETDRRQIEYDIQSYLKKGFSRI